MRNAFFTHFFILGLIAFCTCNNSSSIEAPITLVKIDTIHSPNLYAYAVSSNELWIQSGLVDKGNSVISHLQEQNVQSFIIPGTTIIQDLGGTSPSNIWVLVSGGNNEKVLQGIPETSLFHFNGQMWTTIQLETAVTSGAETLPAAFCTKLWIVSEQEVWVGCDQGIAYHYTENALSRLQMLAADPDLKSIKWANRTVVKAAGLSPQNVWFSLESEAIEEFSQDVLVHWNGSSFDKPIHLPNKRYQTGWQYGIPMRLNSQGELSLVAYDTTQNERNKGAKTNRYVITFTGSSWRETNLGPLHIDPDLFHPHDGFIAFVGESDTDVLIGCRQAGTTPDQIYWSLCKPVNGMLEYIFPTITDSLLFLSMSPDKQSFFVLRSPLKGPARIVRLDAKTFQESPFFEEK